MGEMNRRRAAWADHAVQPFQIDSGTDREDAIADLLYDLMHLADEEEDDFENMLATARQNYEGEVMDDE